MTHVTAQILDGTATAKAIKVELTDRVAALREQGVVPGLGTVLVGDDPGSQVVRRRQAQGLRRGRHHLDPRGPAGRPRPRPRSRRAVDRLNADPACTGYIVQLPLPRHMDEHDVLGRMDPAKDADGLHPTNLGWLVLGKAGAAALHAVRHRRAAPPPRRARSPAPRSCVVGRGVTVGRPLGLLLTRRSENATVTLCHTGTRDLAAHVRNADIVVAAAGVPGHHLRRHGQARCRGPRRGRLAASTARSPATWPRTCTTWPAGSRRTPAASAR